MVDLTGSLPYASHGCGHASGQVRKLTLNEVVVLIGLGVMLTALLVLNLSRERSKSFQAACLSNLMQWGLAIRMYADDHNDTYYYYDDVADVQWDDDSSPYLPYIAGTRKAHKLRICPARAARMTQAQITSSKQRDYSMPLPSYTKNGVVYETVGVDSPFSDAHGNIWPTLRRLRKSSEYLMLLDSSGNPLSCGGLNEAVNGVPANDTVRAINRHGRGVNCLFGDFHAEFVSYDRIVKQDMISCSSGNPWFMMN
jgi:prepilin-type processing-associated H-X9-DG protein